MNENLREEAAAIARSVRRYLERELHAGNAELAARAASPAARRAPAAAAGRGASGTPSSPALAAAPSPAVIAEPETDLFGQPIALRPKAASSAGPASVEVTLHPRDPVARRAISAEAAAVLEQIAAEVRGCRQCGLWETRNQAVPGVGTALSGIAFVGEAPGADEDRLGEPFVGRAGQLLDRIIKAMDDAHLIPGVPLNRQTVFIGNVIHCRPPENRMPLAYEVEQSAPYLHRQLEAIRPRIVCCLGKTAAEHLLGSKASLASLRGKVYRFHGAKLIVTYHTAAVLRNPELKRPVWEDMQLLAREYHSD
jgi:uracil-DNA glycosylase family 4